VLPTRRGRRRFATYAEGARLSPQRSRHLGRLAASGERGEHRLDDGLIVRDLQARMGENR
jgi:hypothetical protein